MIASDALAAAIVCGSMAMKLPCQIAATSRPDRARQAGIALRIFVRRAIQGRQGYATAGSGTAGSGLALGTAGSGLALCLHPARSPLRSRPLRIESPGAIKRVKTVKTGSGLAFCLHPRSLRACPAHRESNPPVRSTTSLREATGANRSLLTSRIDRHFWRCLTTHPPTTGCAKATAAAWQIEGYPVTAATHRPAQQSAGTVRQPAAC